MYPKRESLLFCKHCPTEITDAERLKWFGLCRSCAQETLDAFKGLLLADFTERERLLLNDCFDGASLVRPQEVRLPE